MGLGILASALTLGFLLKEVIFNSDFRDVIKTLPEPLDASLPAWAVFSAGAAAVLFIISRWCSQILMERQVYGIARQCFPLLQQYAGGRNDSADSVESKVLHGLAGEKAAPFLHRENE